MAVKFLGSFTGSTDLPYRKGEIRIAFLGRSNVGKSSILNLLAGTSVARVSKTPGRTRALNLFEVDGKWIFGDFPGYGYAHVSKKIRSSWDVLIRRYLTAEFFHGAIHIVDARHVGMETDIQLQEWLQHVGLPSLILLNKVDKLNQKERVEAERKAREVFPSRHLLFTSAVTGEGKRELKKFLQNPTFAFTA